MNRDTFHIIFQKTKFEILEFFVDFVLLKCYCHKRVCQHGMEIVERRGERGGRETCFKVVYFKFELSAFFLFLSLSLPSLYIFRGVRVIALCMYVQQNCSNNCNKTSYLHYLQRALKPVAIIILPTTTLLVEVNKLPEKNIYKKIYIYLSAAATATSFSAT